MSSDPVEADLGDQVAGARLGLAPPGAEEAGGQGGRKLGAKQDVAQHGQVRKDRVALEHHATVGAGFGREGGAVEGDGALRGASLRPRSILRKVVLPQPDGPTRATKARGAMVEVDAFQHDLVAEFLPEVADLDHRAPSRVGPREGRPAERLEREVHGEREERDPEDVGEDHVHREETAHEEDAIAEPGLGRDRLGRDEEQPGRAELQAQAGQQPRQRLRQDHAQRRSARTRRRGSAPW